MSVVGRSIIAHELNVKPRPHMVPAFDAGLVRTTSGDYRLQIYMRLEFWFLDGVVSWTNHERHAFVATFDRQVRSVWEGQTIGTLGVGKPVTLELRLAYRPDWLLFGLAEWKGQKPHWNIEVMNLKSGARKTSKIHIAIPLVELDRQDAVPYHDSSCDGGRNSQSIIAHEFSHMLGHSGDEYFDKTRTSQSPHLGDCKSVMNAGNEVRDRHTTFLDQLADRLMWKHNGTLMRR